MWRPFPYAPRSGQGGEGRGEGGLTPVPKPQTLGADRPSARTIAMRIAAPSSMSRARAGSDNPGRELLREDDPSLSKSPMSGCTDLRGLSIWPVARFPVARRPGRLQRWAVVPGALSAPAHLARRVRRPGRTPVGAGRADPK